MKGFVIEKFGLENLTFRDVEESGEGIRLKITMAAINPLDFNLVNGKVVYGVAPMPHIAGSEVIGEVMDDGVSVRKGKYSTVSVERMIRNLAQEGILKLILQASTLQKKV